jgi:hypothetical protein
MRIIKDVDNVIKVIVGEMLNIETSTLSFIDGNPADVPANLYGGYPRLIDGNIINIIRASVGAIYLPEDVDIHVFTELIIQQIEIMEKDIKQGKYKCPIPLERYQTIKSGPVTNLKLKSSQMLTVMSEKANNKIANNVRRAFIKGGEGAENGRFCWKIKAISCFDFLICSSDGMRYNIERHAASIFYDKDDICSLGHNDVTFTFTKEMLVGYKNMIDETVKIFEYGPPLLIELGKDQMTWHSFCSDVNLRNIDRNKVYSRDYLSLKFKPIVVLAEDGAVTDVCVRCHNLLWGDNYALDFADGDKCSAICSLCLHSVDAAEPYEERAYYIYRFTSPRSVYDMIDATEMSDIKRDILLNMLKHIEVRHITLKNGSTIPYYVIGDDYIGIIHPQTYLFSSLCKHPELEKRKVFCVDLVR